MSVAPCWPIAGLGLILVGSAASVQSPATPPKGPFGLSRLEVAGGGQAALADMASSQDCAVCHPRQWSELKGSMHSVSHEDLLYRSFAELARKEAGPEMYAFCSGCHSPAGVVAGLIPDIPEQRLPEAAKAGVTCDVCHQMTSLTGSDGPWGEPGNASFALDPGPVKRGPHAEVQPTPAHESVRSEALSSSEFCASCHTVIHPLNGLRIEHTYDEWKDSIYAERGIQCQDCHMRTVEDAVRVAQDLEPVQVQGSSVRGGPEREISPHLFVGGNVEARRLGGGGRHAALAARRLKSAATLDLETVASVATGGTLEVGVLVTNVGAGHNLPTSLTELREMWIHLRVIAADGQVLHESGALDDEGELSEDALRFGSALLDANGEITHRPWEAVSFAWKRLVPPKGSVRDVVPVAVPASTPGPLTIEARLLYRIASPRVLREVMGELAFSPEVTEMASARGGVAIES